MKFVILSLLFAATTFSQSAVIQTYYLTGLDTDGTSQIFIPAPSGSLELSNDFIFANLNGGVGSGYQSVELGSLLGDDFQVLYTFTSLPLVHFPRPFPLPDGSFFSSTVFSYQEEIPLSEVLEEAFLQPDELRLKVVMPNGETIFRGLAPVSIPEPSVALLCGIGLLFLGRRQRGIPNGEQNVRERRLSL
jgi:hypothetical protein